MCDSRYDTGNLKRHISACPRKSRNVGQIILFDDMKLKSTKFDKDMCHGLMVAAIVKHDLLFSFVGYDGVRALLKYLNENIIHISRNSLKVDLTKIFKREK